MPERKYSVAEIDRMRVAVQCLVNIGGNPADIVKIHEERLRTYMLNGTGPEELERHALELERNRLTRLLAQCGESSRVDAATIAKVHDKLAAKLADVESNLKRTAAA